MSRIASSAICLTFLACVASPAAGQEQPKLPDEAVKAIDAEDWPKAIELLAPLAKDEKNALANFHVGAAYYAQGKRNEAVAHLVRAMRADPACRATAMMLARCASGEGADPSTRLPGYVSELQEAWGFDGDVVHCVGCAWMNKFLWKRSKSIDLLSRGRDAALANAVECFRRAEELGTTMNDNDRWLAFLHYRDDNHAEALKHALRAAKTAQAGYEVYLIIGGSLVGLARPVEAEIAFAEAKRLAPGKAPVIEYERGKALCAAGRYNEALQAFSWVLSKSWDQYNVRHWLGEAAFGAKDYRLALWAFIESNKVDGRIDDLYYMGRCAYAMERYDLAEKYFQQAIDAYCAKMKTRGKDVNGPSLWVHYLGRAQWGQKKYDEALKNLQDAFDRWTTNTLHARWLYRAYLARDDLYGAIEVCRKLGRYSKYRRDAIAGVLNILEKWPAPRIKDAFTGKGKPHVFVAYDVLADLYESDGRYFTAVHYYTKGKRTRGPSAVASAGWSLVHVGRAEDAALTFQDYIKYYKNKDYGRWGLAAALAASGKWAEAGAAFSEIKKESMLPGRDAGMLYSAIAAGDAEAGKLADAYTLLGFLANRRNGASRGEEILFVIPGGVLDAARPKLMPRDVLVQVGEMPLGDMKQLEEFRKSEIPAAPVEALVRRGKSQFYVTLDYQLVVRKLPAEAATQPATTEVEQ